MLQTKKGGVVVLIGFTGIRLSEVTCTTATKTEIRTIKKDGTEMIFDRKTGIQTNPRDAKYANKIVSLEDAPAKKEKKAPKKKAPKAKKVEAPVEEEFEEIEEDVEEVEAPAPKKKAKAKKKAKKAVPAPVEDEFDDEDDEYEEV